MRDPYEVLGVAKTATGKDIKSAYRKQAKKYHPDQNPDDPKAKERFNAATQAYDIVGDEKNRAAFDRGEIDGEGKPKFQGFEAGGGDPFAGFRSPGGPGSRYEFRSGGGDTQATSSARYSVRPSLGVRAAPAVRVVWAEAAARPSARI